jgi:hypothetical protein
MARGTDRQAAVEYALKAASLAQLIREISIHEALAAVGTASGRAEDEMATPRELADAARQAYRREVLGQIEQLEAEGKGRSAAAIVARQHADPRDLIERETLANKFRRWRRAEKRAYARLPASP